MLYIFSCSCCSWYYATFSKHQLQLHQTLIAKLCLQLAMLPRATWGTLHIWTLHIKYLKWFFFFENFILPLLQRIQVMVLHSKSLGSYELASTHTHMHKYVCDLSPSLCAVVWKILLQSCCVQQQQSPPPQQQQQQRLLLAFFCGF